jgi:hypothetical protein
VKVNSTGWDRFRTQVEVELEQLDRLRLVYQPVVNKALQLEPDLEGLSALGVLLHSFYTGAENIFRRAVLEIDGNAVSGESWHRDLLDLVEKPSTNRPAIISPDLRGRLDEYLAFRHVFRSAYGFVLNWKKMAPLVQSYDGTQERLFKELREFLARQPDRSVPPGRGETA